jgi:Raf kinase inhibitor-like YbhB/YbcL family protein
MKQLIVTSPAFKNNMLIPSKYTCDGDDVNPPLTVKGTPEGTKSMSLVVEDPDAPVGLWIHWLVWNIPPTSTVGEDTVPGVQGLNTWRRHAYGGPCPPSGTHRYFFKVYALDTNLDLAANSEKKDVEKAVQNHVLAQGELVGLYRRSK